MKIRHGCRLAVALLVAGLVPIQAQSALSTSAKITISEQVGSSSNTLFTGSDDSDSDTASAVGASAISPLLGNVHPESVALARPGYVAARVDAEADFPGESRLSSDGNAEAIWTARPVIDVPGVAPGTPGTAQARILFEGTHFYRRAGFDLNTFYRATGSANMAVTVAGVRQDSRVSGSYVDNINDRADSKFRMTVSRPGIPLYYPTVSPPLSGDSYLWSFNLRVDFGFRTGEPFDLLADLDVRGDASVITGCCDVDWTTTSLGLWQGLSDVRIDGVGPAANFTAVDQFTGSDLADAAVAPIPVPGALWLLAGPLLMLSRRLLPA